MRFLTAGESHGKALVGILEGVPAGLEISSEDIQTELSRRKKGFGRGDRQKIETDQIEILSGVRFGKTLGSPICLKIENKDFANWQTIMSDKSVDQTAEREVVVPRPGHADYVGAVKYQHSDMRNVLERASARETAMRVALGSIARCFLKNFDIQVLSRVVQIGENKDVASWPSYVDGLQVQIDESPVRCLSKNAEEKMIAEIEACQKEGNTLGGAFEVIAFNTPIGLGSYAQWDRRIEGHIANAFMSLNAIKAVEIGDGIEAAFSKGSNAHDEIILNFQENIDYKTNRSGGITGGITTGQPLLVRAYMKPLSTLKKPLSSVSLKDKRATEAHFERSDVCAVPSAAVIGESLLCFTLMEEFLRKFGGDSMEEIKPRYKEWKNIETQFFRK